MKLLFGYRLLKITGEAINRDIQDEQDFQDEILKKWLGLSSCVS